MDNKEYLEKILPHKKPMVLLDDVAEYSPEEKRLKAIVTIKNDCMFFDKSINGVPSITGIEYMAQAIGCYAFLSKNQEKPQIGFLLGTRLYNNAVSKFELGKTYTILVKEAYTDEDIVSFDCFIYNENEEEIASATVNTYQNDNIEERLKNE